MNENKAAKAKNYAAASKYYYKLGNIKLAARYWSRIYSVLQKPNDVFALARIMQKFSDEEVFNITDYLREKHYHAVGLI